MKDRVALERVVVDGECVRTTAGVGSRLLEGRMYVLLDFSLLVRRWGGEDGPPNQESIFVGEGWLRFLRR